MAKNEQDEQRNKPLNTYAKFAGLGVQMLAIIGAFTYVGYKIDAYVGHTIQWVTATLSLLGVFLSLFVVFKSLKN